MNALPAAAVSISTWSSVGSPEEDDAEATWRHHSSVIHYVNLSTSRVGSRGSINVTGGITAEFAMLCNVPDSRTCKQLEGHGSHPKVL